MYKLTINILCSLFIIIVSDAVVAKDIQLPLNIDNVYIEQIVRNQLFTGKNNSMRLMDDGSGCRFFKLSDPKISTQNGYIRILSKANVRVGVRSGSKCRLAVDWHGDVEVFADLTLSTNPNVLNINVVNSKITSNSGIVDAAVNTIWQTAQPLLPEKFSQITLDIQEPVNDLKTFLPEIFPAIDRTVVTTIVNSVRVTSTQILDEGVVVWVGMQVPPVPAAGTAKPRQKELSEQEMLALEKRFEALDAFLTFIIKNTAANLNDTQLESELFDILIEARYDIRDALANDAAETEKDPVKELFISVWHQLRPVVRRLAESQSGSQALQFLSFIAAADALQAIDEVGPELGVDISVDGLRRLARIMIPATKEDPVEYNESVDPMLRNLFRLGFLNVAPQQTGGWLDFFVKDALAIDAFAPDVLKTLNNTLPTKQNLPDYLQGVNQVINHVIEQQLAKGNLDKGFHTVYEDTVYTVAWQESCWRQFVVHKGQRVPLRSKTGDVGIMQVNARVWRGFFDLNELKWNMLYNAEAGSEILMRYMTRYAIANEEHKKPGEMDNLPRSTYSAYNGGPKRFNRYRLPNVPKRLKKIDELFYDKYLVVKQGDKFAVRSCLDGG